MAKDYTLRAVMDERAAYRKLLETLLESIGLALDEDIPSHVESPEDASKAVDTACTALAWHKPGKVNRIERRARGHHG